MHMNTVCISGCSKQLRLAHKTTWCPHNNVTDPHKPFWPAEGCGRRGMSHEPSREYGVDVGGARYSRKLNDGKSAAGAGLGLMVIPDITTPTVGLLSTNTHAQLSLVRPSNLPSTGNDKTSILNSCQLLPSDVRSMDSKLGR